MKKTLIVAALAGAFAAGAQAADVQVYGLIDTGLSFTSSDSDQPGADSVNTFSMENGLQYGSRFGLRGNEDLGNGLKVGFMLENGFKSDTGAIDDSASRLFGREAWVSLSGDFGTVWMGRMPIYGSVLGVNGLFRAIDPVTANYTSALGSGAATASNWTRVDNALSYRTPTFAGFTGYAMYATKSDSTQTGDENKAQVDRYASLAARYQQGALEAIVVADMTLWGSDAHGANFADVDDGFTVTVGGNYTLGNGLKLIAFYQYFDSMFLNTAARAGVTKDGVNAMTGNAGYGFVDGWGASFGVNFPLAGGVAKAAVNYRDMDNTVGVDFTRWTVNGGYDYPLSKRTTAYVLAGYTQEKVETAASEATPSGCQVAAGVVHRF